MPDGERGGDPERRPAKVYVSVIAAAKHMGMPLRELALLTMEDFDAVCLEYAGREPRGAEAPMATQEQLNRLFPR